MRIYLLILYGTLLLSINAQNIKKGTIQQIDLNAAETTILPYAHEEKTERTTAASTIDRSSYVHIHTPPLQGFWTKKFAWRPRWVKTWQPKKVYVAVWKRMWSPAVTKEWVPIPKPPPGWVKRKAFGKAFVRVG